MTTRLGGHTGRIAFAAILLGPLLACASNAAKPDHAAAPPAPVAPREDQSVEEMLTGRFPGVTVDRATGGGIRIRIRGGNSSFYNGEEPLYIVDDVPIPQGSGGVLFLNPHDITKIEVLKNPADVAIYGMRGANGVIKVTTTAHARG